ncbi:hypothetical protein CDAR_471881 [Caerostris darwini]|uniref:Secreted protein n=1 Tax=Caerostris darwini TaxID=1538125 RepID=A0AAV4VNN3_9ARAC|nr:hypothetical protein CDAR_471881 [Caerostris darwini]
MICQPCVRNQIGYPLLILVVTVTGATSNNIDAITHQCIEGRLFSLCLRPLRPQGHPTLVKAARIKRKGFLCALSRKQARAIPMV